MKIHSIILLGLSAILFTACIHDKDKNDDPDPATSLIKTGDRIPAFTVAGKMGSEDLVFDASALDTRLTLISFFNPGCGDCKREHPKLQYVWDQLKDTEGFRMVNIVRAMTLEGLEKEGADWMKMPCYEDPDKRVYDRFATAYIPRIYLVDQSGIVRQMWVEYLRDEDKRELSKEQFLQIVKGWLEKP